MTEALPDKVREALVAQIPMGYGADPWDVAQTVTVARDVLHEMDPLIPLGTVRSLRDVWRASMVRQEFVLTLLAVFGAMALLLAAVGVYGVTAQATRKRTQEIGIRMAVGARRHHILLQFLVEAVVLSAAGGAIGTNDFRLSDMGPDGDTGYFAFNPAVAFNATADEYLVVWYGTDNTAPLVANENEIFGQRLDGTGGELGANDFRISDMGPNGNSNYSAYDPVVAWNAIANEYLVVWHGDDNTAPLVNGEGEIFGQRLDAAGGETGTNDFRLSDMGPDGDANFYAADAAVAWRSMTNEYLVVWYGDDDTGALVDDENEIFGQLYRLFSSIPLAGGGGGGGCTLNPAATRHDPVIPLLMLIAAGCLLRRRVRRQASLGSTACG